ncbi:MAG: hypothetical protein M0033_10040 [Nitrospiraceae bacterium]|nr:hypothetical protein [Nitrospiraceae bacterium]
MADVELQKGLSACNRGDETQGVEFHKDRTEQKKREELPHGLY